MGATAHNPMTSLPDSPTEEAQGSPSGFVHHALFGQSLAKQPSGLTLPPVPQRQALGLELEV